MWLAILMILLTPLSIGALPTGGHSENWGYGPSAALTAVAVVLAFLVICGVV